MPKSKSRKKSARTSNRSIDWSASADKKSSYFNLVLGGIALAAVAAGAIYLWSAFQTQDAFADYAAQGQSALAKVETTTNFGRNHLSPGQSHSYSQNFPTSGTHQTSWINPGFYSERQPPTQLVHSLEHGHIVIYYEDPGADAVTHMKDWASLYGADWQGVIATPSSGLGQAVVLTAWRKILKLDRFEAAAAAAFIDEFRGRGPEHPVR